MASNQSPYKIKTYSFIQKRVLHFYASVDGRKECLLFYFNIPALFKYWNQIYLKNANQRRLPAIIKYSGIVAETFPYFTNYKLPDPARNA